MTAALLAPFALIGLFVVWHVVRSQRAPADTSNRLNKLRLLWYALTREDELSRVVDWLRLDESDIAPLPHNGFIVVALDTGPTTTAHYADSLPDAIALRRELESDGGEWRIYRRAPDA